MTVRRMPDPTSRRERLVGTLRAVPIALFLGSSLLLFNLLQTLSVLIRPFSRRLFRRVNRWVADTWWGWCVILAGRFTGVRTVISGDPVPVAENAILIANHQQMPDIIFLLGFARSKARLGDLKWFVKRALRHVPGIGWGMVFLDCLFVSRDWTSDRDTIRRTFARLLADDIPMWVVNFPEGTRVTTSKLERSREWARTRGLAPLEHVLEPRPRGFVASATALRHRLDAVYDVTIAYPAGIPTLGQFIRGFVPSAHLHVRRFPTAALPEDPEILATWLRRRFVEKDRLLAAFQREGRFNRRQEVFEPTGAEVAGAASG